MAYWFTLENYFCPQPSCWYASPTPGCEGPSPSFSPSSRYHVLLLKVLYQALPLAQALSLFQELLSAADAHLTHTITVTFSSNTFHHSQFLRTSCNELLLLSEMPWLYSPSMWVRSELCNQHKPHPCDTKITTEHRRAIQLQKNSAPYKAAMVISIIKNTCATSAMPPLRTVNSQVLHNWEAATHICKSNISGRKYFLSLNSRIHGRSCAWYPVWRHF